MCLRLLRGCRLTRRGGLFGGIFEEAAMLLKLTGKGFDLSASLRKIIVSTQDALREIGDSISI
jgi:hypothetical protein